MVNSAVRCGVAPPKITRRIHKKGRKDRMKKAGGRGSREFLCLPRRVSPLCVGAVLFFIWLQHCRNVKELAW